jgi:prophage regulatory protein
MPNAIIDVTSTPTTPRRILRQPVVVERIGVNATTLYRWELKGLFPRRVLLGPNSIGWYSDEVEGWLAGRQRQAETGRPSPNPKAHKTAEPAPAV